LPRHDRARRKLAEYAAQGALQPTIAKIFPLSDAPEALRYLIEGRPFGRVLMRVNS
jgi:NADPH:quinone reductase